MIDSFEVANRLARERVGAVLHDKWRIFSLLGVGGMAAVYGATHVNNGKRVALKVLHRELSNNTEARTRFLREGYLANKVEHPGTVQVIDDDVAEDGVVFLVMELLEGETLEARRIRSGNVLPASEVLPIADRVLDILVAAHEKGIVHRDIKPDNIFLMQDGSVKLLDFGIARLRELSSSIQTMTGAGAIGTPAFMPPEQARGRTNEVGPRTDLWAVGATMFTALSGRLIHQAETVNELLLLAMTKPAPAVASQLPNLPVSVAAVIDRSLAYEPEARWPDARSMQSMVRLAFQSLSDPSSSAGLIPPGGTVRMNAPSAAIPMPAVPPRPAAGYGGYSPATPLSAADPITFSGGRGPPVSSPRGGPIPPPAMVPPPALVIPYGMPPPQQDASSSLEMTMNRRAAPRKSNLGLIFGVVGFVVALAIGALVAAIYLMKQDGPTPDLAPSADAAVTAAPSASIAPAMTAAPAPPADSAAPSADSAAPPDPSAKTKPPLKPRVPLKPLKPKPR